MIEIGIIVKAPDGYIKITGDQRHCQTTHSKWRLFGHKYDPNTGKISGERIELDEKQVEEWIKQ